MQNSDFWTRITRLYDPQTSPVIMCIQNNVNCTRITGLNASQPTCVVFASKTASLGPELHVSMGPSPHLLSLHAKQRLLDRITSLYGSQISSVVLCMQNDVISIRITSLYGSQPTSVVFDCKTETFGPELQTSIVPRPHLSFCACKTAWIAPELLVSIGPSPHLWFLLAKQRLLEHNY